jgi:transcriptional regulator with XRE-family HTH domain
VGTLLKEWRTARGLSLGELARKAGVGKATLSYWERGARQPSATELDAVLDTLGVAPHQKCEAWSRVDAPRAARRLRELAATSADALDAPPIVSGDLLRALRLRGGRTLEQVAAICGVRSSAVSRWERSEDRPSAERLQILCRFLGAHPDEVVALTTLRFSLATGLGEPRGDALDASREEHARLWFDLCAGRRALMDLRFLALEARLWPLLSGCGAPARSARHLLAMVYTFHAQWLQLWGRNREAVRYAYRSLGLAETEPLTDPYWLWTVDIIARNAGREGRHTKPLEAARIIRAWLPATVPWPRFDGWFRLSLAEHVGAAGDVASALELTAQARDLVARSEAPLRNADLGRARALLRAGRAAEALALLPTDENPLPSSQVAEHLLWAETFLALGERAAAEDRLVRAYATVTAQDLAYLRPRADALAQRL